MPRLERNRSDASNYPTRIESLLNPPMKFKRDALSAVRVFKASKPYRGTLLERIAKFNRLHHELSLIYNMRSQLIIDVPVDAAVTGNGSYSPDLDVITLTGKLSIVTYLHEFAHSMNGSDEEFAVRWSLNLFRAIFPKLFARMSFDGHMARPASHRLNTLIALGNDYPHSALSACDREAAAIGQACS